MPETDLKTGLEGVFVPMFTPFTENGRELDEDMLRAHVRYLVSRGIRLLNPAGTTGEFWTLRPEERRRLLRAVTDEARRADPNVIVIAGTSTAAVTQTVELTRFAADCGARLAQVTLPFYLPVCEEDAVAYYRTVSEEGGIGVMAYEIPAATGVRLRGPLLERICEEAPGVVSLKTAALADAPREFERIVRRFGNRLRIFAATGAYYSPFAYMTGIAGITDTLANAAPEFGLTLHRLARAERWSEMNRLYQDAFAVLEIELLYGRGGLKEIGRLCGVCNGVTRFPMIDALREADRQDIRRRLLEWSFTHDLVTGKQVSPAAELTRTAR